MRTGIEVDIDATGAKRGADQYVRATERMAASTAKATGRMEKGIASVKGQFKAFAAFAGTFALAGLIRNVVRTAAKFEQLGVQLETVEGSAAKAREGLAFVTEFTATTPFQLENVTASFIRLRNFGIDPLDGSLKDFGDLAAAFGEDISQAVMAVTAAVSGENEQLKRFGIVARSETNSVSLTFRGQTTSVNRDAKSIAGALRKLASTNFSGAMERQLDTLDGAFSNLQDNASLLADAIGKGGLNEEIRKMANELKRFAETDEAAVVAQNLAKGLRGMARGLGNITAVGVQNFTNLVNVALLLGGATGVRAVGTLLGLGAAATTAGAAFLALGGGFLVGNAIQDQIGSTIDGMKELETQFDLLSDKSIARLFKDFLGTDNEGNSLGADSVAELRIKANVDPVFRQQLIAHMAKAQRDLDANVGLVLQMHLDLGLKNAADGVKKAQAYLDHNPVFFAASVDLADMQRELGDFGDLSKGSGLGIDTDPFASLSKGFDKETLTRIKTLAGELEEQGNALEKLFSQDIPSATDLMAETAVDAFNQLGQGIANMVTGGKLDFAELANSIIAQMIRIFIQAQLLGLASTLFGGGGNTGGAGHTFIIPGGGGTGGGGGGGGGTGSGFDSFLPSSQSSTAQRPNNVNVVVQTQPGETATVTERQTGEGVQLEIITEQITGKIAGRAARGGGPFAGAVSSPARFQR